MRIYRFFNSEYGLKTIKERRLKVSILMDLNDPFEFLVADLSDKTFRKAMKMTKEQISKLWGTISFSESWDNPLLWSHYSDKHQGLCLGFEIQDKYLTKVKYIKQRIGWAKKIDGSTMRKFLTAKSTHWNYEKEYRLCIALEEPAADGLFYADFSESVQLKQVMVGDRSIVSRQQVAEALGELSNKVKAFKVRPAFKNFDVVKNKNESLWK